jgi:hypothetical protein
MQARYNAISTIGKQSCISKARETRWKESKDKENRRQRDKDR